MTHILLISANFYPDIANELVKGADVMLRRYGATFDHIEVPGAFEIPAAIRFAMAANKYDGFCALGCVIRGETTHYDYVCSESARGLMDLALQFNVALGFGILTVENMAQAQARAAVSQGNKGGDTAAACLRMIELKRQFGSTS